MERREFLFGGATVALAGSASAAEPVPTPPPLILKPLDIPFRVTRGVAWTLFEVGALEPQPFGLNVANGWSHCHPSIPVKLGLLSGRQTRQVTLQFTRVRIGGRLVDEGLPCSSSPFGFEGRPVAGLLGLRRYDPFEFDWDRGVLTLSPRTPPEAELLPVYPRPMGPAVDALVDGEPARLSFGSVDVYGLQLSPAYVRRRGLWDRYPRRRNNVDENGAVTFQTAVIPSLKIGPLEFRDVITRLLRTETPQLYDQMYTDAAIGTDLLRRMTFWVDRRTRDERKAATARVTAAKRGARAPADTPTGVRVAYSKGRNEPQVDDRAGMVLSARNDGIAVVQVDPSSPAYKAGIRRGDYIEGHQGEAGLPGLPWALTRPAGTEVELLVARGAAKAVSRRIVLEDRV